MRVSVQCRTQALKLLTLAAVAFSVGFWTTEVSPQTLGALVHNCPNFSTVLGSAVHRQVPALMASVLSLVDHVYIISLDSCNFVMSASVSARSTCIHGRILDNCTPAHFLRGLPHELHGLKVTFTHAVIMQLARESGFRNIAVIEDDLAIIRNRIKDVSEQTTLALSSLINSNAWSLIRFGFRPYFLQHDGTAHCPRDCRCKLSPQFGSNFCEMRKGGCDVRSSDFYIIKSNYFVKFQQKMLNTRVSNVQRIVDLHPIQSFPRQWFYIPQISFQRVLDIPTDYQIGIGALFIKKCVHPRPLPPVLMEQLLARQT